MDEGPEPESMTVSIILVINDRGYYFYEIPNLGSYQSGWSDELL